MTLEQMLQQAVAHHTAGRLAQAEQSYRAVLGRSPRHPDALHLLGVLYGQRGQIDLAVQLIIQAIEERPSSDPMRNLARLLADNGRYADAASWYERATQVAPSDALAWYALGVCRRRLGDMRAAVAALERAIALSPELGDAYFELGGALRTEKRVDEALAAYLKAHELQPNSAPALNSLGLTLQDMNRLHEAIQVFYRATQLDGSQVTYYFNLGNALLLRGAFGDALRIFDTVLARHPRNAEAQCGRARALCELGQYEEALSSGRRAVELDPQSFKTYASVGDTYREMQQTETAIPYYQQALERNQGSSETLVCLGDCFRSLGKFEEAGQLWRKVLELDADNTAAHQMLALLTKGHTTHEVGRLRSQVRSNSLNRTDRITAGFAAGKCLDDEGRFDEAFEEYVLANRLQRERLAEEGESFDRSKLASAVSETIGVFTPAFFRARREWGEPTEVPVFIVGMPRSGTTLVEQILASHSKVFGAGELSAIGDHSILLAKDKPGPAPMHWTRQEISDTARSHLEYLGKLGRAAVRIVDKLPGNILELGLIATLFPKARVIFCRRDPIDNCLSCFFQIFKKNNLAFSYALEDCAAQYLEQERLKAHWLTALPTPMLTIQYEELVADLEGQSRRLIEFLGLDWEPACLEFHKTERTVMTASVWQVRQPIYTGSVGRWKAYEKHLGPLLAALSTADRI